MSKKLSTTQLYLIVLGMGLILFVLVIYMPIERDVLMKRAELSAMESNIDSLDTLMDNEKPFGERVRLFREKGELLRAKFPSHEKDALKMISKIAPQFKLSIRSLQSQPPTDTLDEVNQPLEIEGKKCQSVLVLIQMQGNYKRFLDFIERLKKDLPYFTISRYSLKLDEQTKDQLSINLEMYFYLIP